MVLKAGDLKHKITFLEKKLISGNHGKEEVFYPFLPVKAKVTQPQSSESDSEHGKTVKRRLVIFIRFNAKINEEHRLLYNGVEFEITSCRDVKGTRRELIIDAEKRS